MTNEYKDLLKKKMDCYAHQVYNLTKNFPREEVYGITSQWRRSSLSIVLNYIEGNARLSERQRQHFLEISYGSFRESSYLLQFCYDEDLIGEKDYVESKKCADEIGAMLWTDLKNNKEYVKLIN